VGGEDAGLGARRVVLGQFGDRGEELRAEFVVEVFRRDRGRLGLQVLDDLGAQRVRIGDVLLQEGRFGVGSQAVAQGKGSYPFFIDFEKGLRPLS